MRRCAVGMVAAVLATACTKEPAKEQPEPAAASPSGVAPVAAPAPPAEAEEPRTARVYAECWGHLHAGRWREAEGCYAAGVTSRQQGFSEVASGPAQALARGARALFTAFPDGRAEPQLTLVNGRRVAAILHFRGTQTGVLESPLGRLAPTGRKVGFLVLHRVDLDESGHITAERWFADTNTLLGQLGVLEGAGRPLLEKGDPSPAVVLAARDERERANEASYREAKRRFNAHDPGLFDFWADDMLESNILAGEDVVGKREVISSHRSFWKGFPDVGVKHEEVWCAGEYVYVLNHMAGTNTGEMPDLGMSKTGRKLDLDFAEIVKWKDGKEVSSRLFMNGLELGTQLGLMERPQLR